MNIHIVLYSQAEGVGGRRETWISYCLPARCQSKVAESIHVYCLPETLPSRATYHGTVLPDELPTVLASNRVVLFFSRSTSGLAGGLSQGLLDAMSAGRLMVAWNNLLATKS